MATRIQDRIEVFLSKKQFAAVVLNKKQLLMPAFLLPPLSITESRVFYLMPTIE